MKISIARLSSRALAATWPMLLVLFAVGCPVAQIPRTPTENENANVSGGGTSAQSNSNTAGSTVRPIPGVPVEIDENTDVGDSSRPQNDSPAVAVLAVVITNFASTANTLAGSLQVITYDTLGGRAEDGSIRATLFYDGDGVDLSGDEHTLLEGLPARGNEEFSTAGIAPGRYFLGVRAQNNVSKTVRYAAGQLEIVGDAALTVQRPSASVRVRPADPIEVRATITTLARNVSWRVFVDDDHTFNGNETTAFVGGGFSVSGSIVPLSFVPGEYSIGVEVGDSVGQRFIFYVNEAGGDCVNNGQCRTFIIDEAPAITVVEPTQSLAIQPGQDTVHMRVIASDREANATVTLFRDANGVLDGDEFTLGEFELNTTQGAFELDVETANLFPARYRFGAMVSDGVGQPVSAYAPAVLDVLAPVSVFGAFRPASDFGRRLGDANSTVTIGFFVSDPNRRLAAQPEGIELRLYVDNDIDGAPDSTTPLVVAAISNDGRPFQAGLNTYIIDFDTLNAGPLGSDGLLDLVGELILRETQGNERVVFSEGPVARLDAVAPQLLALTPNQTDGNVTLAPGDTLRFRVNDNETTLVLPYLYDTVMLPDGREILRTLAFLTTNVIVAPPNTIVEIMLDEFDAPPGVYKFAYAVVDSTPDPILFEIVGLSVTID